MNLIFPSQIGRLSYLTRALLFTLVTYPAIPLFDESEKRDLQWSDLWLLLLAIAIVTYWLAYIIRPRCKDIGIKWWFGLLTIIPIVGLVAGLILLFKPAKPQLPENENGA